MPPRKPSSSRDTQWGTEGEQSQTSSSYNRSGDHVRRSTPADTRPQTTNPLLSMLSEYDWTTQDSPPITTQREREVKEQGKKLTSLSSEIVTKAKMDTDKNLYEVEKEVDRVIELNNGKTDEEKWKNYYTFIKEEKDGEILKKDYIFILCEKEASKTIYNNNRNSHEGMWEDCKRSIKAVPEESLRKAYIPAICKEAALAVVEHNDDNFHEKRWEDYERSIKAVPEESLRKAYIPAICKEVADRLVEYNCSVHYEKRWEDYEISIKAVPKEDLRKAYILAICKEEAIAVTKQYDDNSHEKRWEDYEISIKAVPKEDLRKAYISAICKEEAIAVTAEQYDDNSHEKRWEDYKRSIKAAPDICKGCYAFEIYKEEASNRIENYVLDEKNTYEFMKGLAKVHTEELRKMDEEISQAEQRPTKASIMNELQMNIGLTINERNALFREKIEECQENAVKIIKQRIIEQKRIYKIITEKMFRECGKNISNKHKEKYGRFKDYYGGTMEPYFANKPRMDDLSKAAGDYYNMICTYIDRDERWDTGKRTVLQDKLTKHGAQMQKNINDFIELGNDLRKLTRTMSLLMPEES